MSNNEQQPTNSERLINRSIKLQYALDDLENWSGVRDTLFNNVTSSGSEVNQSVSSSTNTNLDPALISQTGLDIEAIRYDIENNVYKDSPEA